MTSFYILLAILGAAMVTFVVLHFWGDDSDPTFKSPLFRSLPAIGTGARGMQVGVFIASWAIQIVFFILFMGISSFSTMSHQILTTPMQSLSFALLGVMNVLFFFLLKRPTLAGRSIMDEIEGFRMYLGTAEEERLNLLNPPDKTPELFEKYLPYALALDVENEWGKKFTAILAAAGTATEGGYQSRWYRGGTWRPGHAAGFGSSLGTKLGTAVASSVRAPGSSSGSGGGGFSGGGGGGGGW